MTKTGLPYENQYFPLRRNARVLLHEGWPPGSYKLNASLKKVLETNTTSTEPTHCITTYAYLTTKAADEKVEQLQKDALKRQAGKEMLEYKLDDNASTAPVKFTPPTNTMD